MKFSILLLLTLGFNACPALAQEGKDNERALSAPIKGPLRQSRNPNYFQDARGTPLILCGSQTWNTLQDWGSEGAVRPLDFDAFVSFLKAHGHNFTLLWCTELPKFRSLPTTESSPPDFTVSPFPWTRTGPGLATDGGLKFNLTKFDQAYFDRLRARVQALSSAGIYVGVYLFSGEFLLRFRCSTTQMPIGSPRRPEFLPPNRAEPASHLARSTSMTVTTVTSECGTIRLRRTEIMPGRIS